jgi:CRISPR-associated protein Cmr6
MRNSLWGAPGWEARRSIFADLDASELVRSHPGLSLARYLPRQGDPDARRRFLESVAGAGVGCAYRAAFDRWRAAQERRPNCHLLTGTLAAPLAVGLGNASPWEMGLTLHHTYGAPMLPGPALKGLCRRGARVMIAEGRLEAAAESVLFGTAAGEESAVAGYCVFWDAWYDPESVEGQPLRGDVVTVHYPGYYRSEGRDAAPTGDEDPNPVSFLVVRPGARFLFAVDAPAPAWGEYTLRLMRWCLETLGAGAKTSAGYGRFHEWKALPREERWTDCRLTRRVVKGAVQVQVEGGAAPLLMEQRQWQPIESGLTAEERDALKQGRLRADARVRRAETGVTLVALEAIRHVEE